LTAGLRADFRLGSPRSVGLFAGIATEERKISTRWGISFGLSGLSPSSRCNHEDALKIPAPEWTERTLIESVRSPFHAESRHIPYVTPAFYRPRPLRRRFASFGTLITSLSRLPPACLRTEVRCGILRPSAMARSGCSACCYRSPSDRRRSNV
jgi:hypothetical protein